MNSSKIWKKFCLLWQPPIQNKVEEIFHLVRYWNRAIWEMRLFSENIKGKAGTSLKMNT
jgi:hypothetical protein